MVHRVFFVLLLLAAGCASNTSTPAAAVLEPEPAEQAEGSQTPATTRRETIVVPLSLHVMVEQGSPTSTLSSTRSTTDLETIATNMAEIWQQANIVFDPVNVHEIEAPTAVLQGIAVGNTDQFFAQVNTTFAVESGQAINGFYVRSAFGVNGFTPQGSNLFFVVDDPSVHDERVSSHEIGHIFGLRHDLDDPRQLMFSGTNGTTLSDLEQTVARYSVQGLFPQGIQP